MKKSNFSFKLRSILLTSLIGVFAVSNLFANNTINVKAIGEEGSFNLAPLSEQYKDWLNLPAEERENVTQPPIYVVKYKPKTTTNTLFSRFAPSLYSAPLLGEDVIPASYDLRDVSGNNYVTSVKDQGSSNLCWAYASTASLESNILITGGLDYDLDEIHQTYGLAYNFSDGANPYGMSNLNGGGNFEYSSNYWTSGIGPIDEASFSADGTTSISANSVLSPESVIQVDNYVDFPYFENSMATLTTRTEFNNLIKNHIMSYGAVFFGSVIPQNVSGLTSYNSTYNTVYTDTQSDFNSSTGHAMVIVGWDDNFDKNKFNTGKQGSKPLNNGAWIAKNSWGTYGDAGYVYYSYEDYFITNYISGVMSTSSKDYDNIYQYNPTGSLTSSTGTYGANVFYKASSDVEQLTEVSFNVMNPNTSYEIYVNAVDDSLMGSNVQKVYTSTVPIEQPGYHTVTLDTPIDLTGEKFVIIVKFINGIYDYNIPVHLNTHNSLGDEAVGVLPKQSYISNDLNNWEEENYSLSIKAFTKNTVVDSTPIIGTYLKVDNSLDITNSGDLIVSNTTKNVSNGEILGYAIKNSLGTDVTSSTSITKYPVMNGSTTSIITIPNILSAGNYTLEVSYSGAVTNTTAFTLTSTLVSSIDINKSSLDTIKNGKEALTVSILPANAVNKNVTWSSNNETVATIDSNGVITALAKGNATITATAQDGSGVTGSMTVNVYDAVFTTPTYGIQNGYFGGALENTTSTLLKDDLTGTDVISKTIIDKDGSTEYTGDKITTGMTLKLEVSAGNFLYYDIIVKGDVDGDGAVTAADILKMKRDILGIQALTNEYNLAGRITNSDTITALDMLKAKRHILGIESLK